MKTIEEKAKAYDEARERAIEMHSVHSEVHKGVTEYIFPELRESEDEMIRRTLVEYFGPEVQLDFVRGVPIQKIRDWLEKQKENPKTADSIPADCASNAKCEDRWHKVNDSLPEDTREVICKDAIGNYFIGRYYKCSDSWEVMMYDDCDKSNEDNPPVVMWVDIPSEKQKEQKPSSGIYWHAIKKGERLPCRAYIWDHNFEKYYDFWEGRLIPNMENILIGRDTWYLPADDVRDLPREGVDELLKEQEPVEWNDTDMKEARNNLISVCRDWERGEQTTLLPIVAVRARYFLEHLTEPKPAEWSEEDERFVRDAIAAVEAFYSEGCGQEELVNWLKSLRPRPSWKPSEEQMKWLKDVIETVPLTCRQQLPLESLYADLQKLLLFKDILPQPKQELDESDDLMLQSVYETLYDHQCVIRTGTMGKIDRDYVAAIDKQIAWLKSLRPSWKPSEEQMDALKDAIIYVESSESNFKGSGFLLESLFNNLQKLIQP